MNTISPEIIDEVWERVNDSSEEDIKALVERLSQAQPAMLAYLTAAEDEAKEAKERGGLLFLGLIVWLVMSEAQPDLPEIPVKDLEAAEEANIAYLQKLEAGSEMGLLDAVQEMISTYNQMPLLGAIVEALMEGNEEEPEMAGENVGMSLLHLKTVIDCLDR